MPPFKRTVLIVSITQFLNYLFPLITFPLLVKTFAVTEYGIWIEAGTIAGLLVTFSAYGITEAAGVLAVNNPEAAEVVYSNALYCIIGVCGALMLLMALTAPLLNEFTTRNAVGVVVIQLLALTVLASALAQLGGQVFRLRQRPLPGAVFDVLLAVGRLAAVVFAVIERDLVTFAAVYALIQMALSAALIVTAYRGLWLRRPLRSMIGRILRYSANLAVVSQASWVIMYGDRLLLSILSTSAAVAVYAASYQLALVLVALAAPYLYVLLPRLGQRWNAQDDAGFSAVFRQSTRFMIILLTPAVIGLLLVGDALLRLLATEMFAQGGLLVGMIAAGVALNAGAMALQYIFYVQGRPQVLRQVYLRAAIFNLVANLAAIPLFSYFGAGFTTLLTFGLIIYWLWRRAALPISALFDLGVLWRCVLASLPMVVWTAAVLDASVAGLLAAIGGSVVIYGGGLLALRVLTIREIRGYLRLLPRSAA